MWHGNVYVSFLVWNVLNNRSQRIGIPHEFQGHKGHSGDGVRGVLCQIPVWMGWTRLRQANWLLDTWSPFLAFHGTLPSPQTSKYLHSPLDPRKICPFVLDSPVARGSKFPGPAPLSTLITVLEFPLAWECAIAVCSAGLLSNAHPSGPRRLSCVSSIHWFPGLLILTGFSQWESEVWELFP